MTGLPRERSTTKNLHKQRRVCERKDQKATQRYMSYFSRTYIGCPLLFLDTYIYISYSVEEA